MKKFLLLLVALVATLSVRAAVDLPYAPNTIDMSEWQVYPTSNGYDNIKTWSITTNKSWFPSQFGNAAMVTWTLNASTIDAWLSTPEFNLSADKSYKVSFWLSEYQDAKLDELSIYLTTEAPSADNADAIAAGTPVFTEKDIYNNTKGWVFLEKTFKFKGVDGSAMLSFHALGNYIKRLTIAGFSIEEAVEVPFASAAPTDLKAVAAPNQLLACDLTWVNPTASTEGEAFTADQTIESVSLYRDDEEEPFKVLEGDVTTFTDTEETGLTPGVHTYAVAVTVAGKLSAKSEAVTTTHIGPYVFTPPYAPTEINFDGEWSVYAKSSITFTNGTSSSWKPSTCENVAMLTWSNTATTVDAWLTTPMFTLSADKRYKVSFIISVWGTGSLENLELYQTSDNPSADNAEAIAAMTPVYTESDIKSNTTQFFERSFKMQGIDGNTRIAFHAFGNYIKRVGICGFSIEEIEEVPFAPAAPTGLKAVAAPNQLLACDLTWVNPSTNTEGEAFTADQTIESVSLYRDDEEEPFKVLEGDVTTFTDTEETGLTPGVHTYAVAVTVAGTLSAKSEAVTTTHIGPYIFTPPYAPTEINFDGEWSVYAKSSVTFTNATNASWKPSAYTNAAILTWSYSESSVDAWLTTPSFTLSADKRYKISFIITEWADCILENLNVYLTADLPSPDNADAIAALTPIYTESGIKSNTSQFVERSFKMQGVDGNARIAFHAFGAYMKRVGICGFSIEEIEEVPFAPAAPTDLKATSEKFSLETVLTWTNPTKDTQGEPFAEGQAVEATVIYRDGDEIARTEGDVTTFTDTEETGLTEGEHTYQIASVVDNTMSALTDGVTVTVTAPLKPIDTFPWSMNLNTGSSDMPDGWAVYQAATGYSAGSWVKRPLGFFLINSYGTEQDTWLISPEFEFSSGDIYEIRYILNLVSTQATPNVEIGLVDSTTPTDWVQLIAPTAEISATDKTEVKVSFTYQAPAATTYADAPAACRIAFRDNSASSAWGHTYQFRSLAVEYSGTTGVSTITGDNADLTDIHVYDLTGRCLGTASSLSLDNYPRGLYIVSGKKDNITKTLKITK